MDPLAGTAGLKRQVSITMEFAPRTISHVPDISHNLCEAWASSVWGLVLRFNADLATLEIAQRQAARGKDPAFRRSPTVPTASSMALRCSRTARSSTWRPFGWPTRNCASRAPKTVRSRCLRPSMLGSAPPGMPPDRAKELGFEMGDASIRWSRPVKRVTRLSDGQLAKLRTQLIDLLEFSWFQHSAAGYAAARAAVEFARKPDGSWRIWYDYRASTLLRGRQSRRSRTSTRCLMARGSLASSPSSIGSAAITSCGHGPR